MIGNKAQSNALASETSDLPGLFGREERQPGKRSSFSIEKDEQRGLASTRQRGMGIGGICPRCWAKLYRAQVKERRGATELSGVCSDEE